MCVSLSALPTQKWTSHLFHIVYYFIWKYDCAAVEIVILIYAAVYQYAADIIGVLRYWFFSGAVLLLSSLCRGAISSAVPGARNPANPDGKLIAFDHPTWAIKHLSSATTLQEVWARVYLLFLSSKAIGVIVPKCCAGRFLW